MRDLLYPVALAVLILSPAEAPAQVPVEVVAVTGDPAPGTGGATFDSFATSVSLNNSAEVLFFAFVEGVGVDASNDHGIWHGAAGALQLVAREGDPAPDTPAGTLFSQLSAARLDQQGGVAFHGRLAGLGVTPDNDEGVWAGTPGSLVLVAREGDPAPGTPAGVTFGLIFSGGQTLLSPDGRVAMAARLTGPGVTSANDQGFWVGPPGALALVAREGDPAPGAPPGAVYNFNSSSIGIVLNGAGDVAFNAFLSGGGTSGGAIWAGSPGSPTLVARKGDQPPGTGPGVEFSSLRSPTLNALGEIAFGATLFGAGVTPANSAGLWAGAPGGLQLVIREGDPAPGGAPGEVVDLGNFPGLQGLTANGLVLTAQGTRFAGPGVSAANDQAVWIGPAGGLQLVAREGDPAPGTPGDTVLANLTRRAANAGDEVLFISNLAGSLISGGANGLWLADGGGVELLLRTDDLIELSPGDVRPVGLIGLFAGGTGQAGFLGSLNDESQAAVRVGIPSLSGQAIVILSADPGPPLADAGPDQSVDEGVGVALDGSGSLPDPGELAFQWTQISGTPIALDDPTAVTPTFTAPAVGPGGEILLFELVVTDDEARASEPDEVAIEVQNANDPPSCELAVAEPARLWPPDHKLVDIDIAGVTDSDPVFNEVALTITGVTQDEPVDGEGDGSTSPDAVIEDAEPRDRVRLRAERAGGGDGRVYAVGFTASDGFESCSGEVLVGVPKSRKSTPVDSGQAYDSTE